MLIIGNHSAGKSSFINWYIGEYVQKESVGMETSGEMMMMMMIIVKSVDTEPNGQRIHFGDFGTSSEHFQR